MIVLILPLLSLLLLGSLLLPAPRAEVNLLQDEPTVIEHNLETSPDAVPDGVPGNVDSPSKDGLSYKKSDEDPDGSQ